MRKIRISCFLHPANAVNGIYNKIFVLPIGGGTEIIMETRVAVMSIIVDDPESIEELNRLLHEHGEYIIGRMGIPYKQKNINLISIAVDAPQNVISSLSGRIGSLNGIGVKIAYSSVVSK